MLAFNHFLTLSHGTIQCAKFYPLCFPAGFDKYHVLLVVLEILVRVWLNANVSQSLLNLLFYPEIFPGTTPHHSLLSFPHLIK